MSAARLGMAFVLSVLTAACATVHIDPVDVAAHRLGEVCIERNPRVLVRAMLPSMRDAFHRHRVRTVVRDPVQLDGCEYVLRYFAVRGWAIATYTKSVTIEISRGDEEIGRIDFEHLGNLARTADKLDPLIDRLLEGQRR